MKILFVVEHFPSLSETFVLTQIVGLLELGHDVEIYAVGQPDTTVVHPDIERLNLRARCWPVTPPPASRGQRILTALSAFMRHPRGWLPLLRTLNVLAYGKQAASLYLFYTTLPWVTHAAGKQYDIILCHFGNKGALAQIWREVGAAHGMLATVFHAHEMCGLTDDEGRAMYRRLFNSNALILPISRYWQGLLTCWGADPKRMRVHHMGINPSQFDYRPQPIEPNEPVRILSVCRLAESKGLLYAIRAVAQLVKRVPRIHYTIVGAGPLRESLEAEVVALGMGYVIEFVGPKRQDEVAELLHTSHIFLSPSVTGADGRKEGIPVALMEAMACGASVVTTRHSGIPELVRDGETGLLADERDVDGLVTALERIITDANLRRRLLDAAREIVDREFNVDVLNRQLAELFQQYLASPHGFTRTPAGVGDKA